MRMRARDLVLPVLTLALSSAAASGQTTMAPVYQPAYTPSPGPSAAGPAAPAAGTGRPADRFTASASTYAPRYGRATDLPPRPVGYTLTDAFLPSGLMFVVPATPASEAAPHGALSLRVQPAHAQVFIDGAYAGTAADFAGAGRLVPEGPHAIEIRAEGYEPHRVDRRILAGETSAYRYDLWAVRPAPVSPNAHLVDIVSVRRPYYVITGCYAGTRPPVPSMLPAGCDARDVRTVEYMVRVPAR